MSKRRVTRRHGSTDQLKLKQPRISSSKARRFFDKQRQRKVTAFKLLVAAMGVYMAARIIKYLLYSVFYSGDIEPAYAVRVVVLYIQSALLITVFALLVSAVIKVILYLVKYEG